METKTMDSAETAAWLHYKETASWSTHDAPVNDDEEVLTTCLAEFRDFYGRAMKWIEAAEVESVWDDPTQIGHDFWLTREGHGAGFWDRYSTGPCAALGRMLTDLAKEYGPGMETDLVKWWEVIEYSE